MKCEMCGKDEEKPFQEYGYVDAETGQNVTEYVLCKDCYDHCAESVDDESEGYERCGDDEPDEDSVTAGEVFGCHFPEKCVMPGRHLKNECHTAEMMAEQEEERS